MDLAKRLVQCKQWRWMTGMRCVNTDYPEYQGIVVDRSTYCQHGHVDCIQSSIDIPVIYWEGSAPLPGESWGQASVPRRHEPGDDPIRPDLADPATVGCLWAMLVEACRTSAVYLYPEFEPKGVLINARNLGDEAFWTDDISDGRALAKALLHVWDTGVKVDVDALDASLWVKNANS